MTSRRRDTGTGLCNCVIEFYVNYKVAFIFRLFSVKCPTLSSLLTAHELNYSRHSYTVQRISVTTYFVLIGYKRCRELGRTRLVLNTCIATEQSTVTSELVNSLLCRCERPNSVQFM